MRENWPAARRELRKAGLVSLLETAAIAALKVIAAYPYLFKEDLGIGENTKLQGINKFAAFMASLSEPLLIAMAAVAPLALIFGAGALMLGHRRALGIIAGTVGGLALAASATGLVN